MSILQRLIDDYDRSPHGVPAGEAIRQAFRKFPEADRQVINIFLFSGADKHRIAEELGVEAKKLTSRFTRALRQFKRLLELERDAPDSNLSDAENA